MATHPEKSHPPGIFPQEPDSNRGLSIAPVGHIPVIDFSYVVDAVHQRIIRGQDLAQYLGYPSEEVLPPLLEDFLHPGEQRKIIRLIRHIKAFVKMLGAPVALSSTFILAHRMKRADGSYAKILRYLQPETMDDTGNISVYHCHCTDISRHPGFEEMSFDIRLPAEAGVSAEEALQYFAGVLDESQLHFTNRELEVLRTWASADTAHDAACRLELAPRTVEAHLKNMRRKLGVKRSMDVVLYARERGWV